MIKKILIGLGIMSLIGVAVYWFIHRPSREVVQPHREEIPVVISETPEQIEKKVVDILKEREELLKAASDNDGDGLKNDEEKRLGTNPEKIDTDNDGLTDEFEVKELKTNPLKADTDGDGISDWNEDYQMTSSTGSNPQ